MNPKNIVSIIITISGIMIGTIVGTAINEIRSLKKENAITEKAMIIADFYKRKGTPASPLEIREIIRAAYKHCAGDKVFTVEDMVAFAMTENDCNTRKKGDRGEVGVYQILDPKTMLKKIGKPNADPMNVDINTEMALCMLHEKYDKHKDWQKTIIAYNGYVIKGGRLKKNYWYRFMNYKIALQKMGVNL